MKNKLRKENVFLFREIILSILLKPTDLSYIQVLKLHIDQGGGGAEGWFTRL